MTWTRATATGKGKLAWRVDVEGWPYEFVSHRDMVLPIKKDGLSGWSASNYYSQGAGLLPGSGTLTVSMLLRVDDASPAATNVLAENRDAAAGWALLLTTGGLLQLTTREAGPTTYTISSAAVSADTVYVVTASFDGSNLRLVLGQTASSPVAGGLDAATGSPGLGAFAGGANPADAVTILGFAYTDSVALSDAQMQAHNARVSAQGVMLNLLDGEHLYQAPDLYDDLVGSADWTVNGKLTIETVDAVTGTWDRKRLHGLKSDGFEFTERVDPVTAEWDPSGFNVIVAGGGKRHNNDAAKAFKRPQLKTHITADVSTTDTSVTVLSTADFPSSGVIHVDTEAIRYASKNSTQFLGCTRAVWGTVAQAHYAADDTENSRSPSVTDVPQVLEGRRVRVYAYGSGDSKQGDGGNSGNPVWFGVAATGPRFDGVNWTFMVDGPSKLFEGKIGADIGDGLPLRGIYYHEGDPLVIQIIEGTTTSIPITSVTGASTSLTVTGFWGTQEAFCTDLTTWLQDVVTSHADGTFSSEAQTSLRAVPNGDSWAIEWKTASSSPLGLLVKGLDIAGRHISRIDGGFSRYPYSVTDISKAHVGGVSASTTYRYELDGADVSLESPGTVPRASIGTSSATAFVSRSYVTGRVKKKDDAAWPSGRVYLGGSAPLTGTITRATLTWPANGTGVDAVEQHSRGAAWTVDSVDTSTRYLALEAARARLTGPHLVATAANNPTIAFGLKYTTGTLANFLDAVTDLWAANINRGLVPDLRNDDIDLTGDSGSAITTAASSTHHTSSRRFIFAEEVELNEVIVEECRLLGVHPAMGTDGKIIFKALRVPALSEASDSTLTSTDILTDDGFLAFEHGQLALWNTVQYETGYNPQEGDHDGDTVIVRDMDALGASPRSRTLTVAPLSEDPSGTVDHAELRKLAGRVLGTYGGDYAILTVAVPLSKWSVSVGDVVAITWSKVPDGVGDLGVTGKLGVVISREWKPMEGRGTFEIVVSDQRIGGYVPSSKVSSEVDRGDDVWEITVETTGYLPTGTSAEDWWTAGDEVRVYQWNNTSAGTVTGSVDSVSGNVVQVTFDSTWTPGSSTWVLSGAVSTSITAAGQKVYVWIARTDGLVHWASSETDDAFTMAP